VSADIPETSMPRRLDTGDHHVTCIHVLERQAQNAREYVMPTKAATDVLDDSATCAV
jgi:predicted Zn-dependent protease